MCEASPGKHGSSFSRPSYVPHILHLCIFLHTYLQIHVYCTVYVYIEIYVYVCMLSRGSPSCHARTSATASSSTASRTWRGASMARACETPLGRKQNAKGRNCQFPGSMLRAPGLQTRLVATRGVREEEPWEGRHFRNFHRFFGSPGPGAGRGLPSLPYRGLQKGGTWM